MIELLIIYSLNKRERTLYSLRSDIIEKFGYFTRPSIGTLHPALKKMLGLNVLTVRNDFSQGGKKSTFYGLASGAMKYFKQVFDSPLSENPTLFFTELQSKIAVLSLLSEQDKLEFFKDVSLKLESYRLDLRNVLEDEYIKLDIYQECLLKKNIENVEKYIELVEKIK